MSEPIDTAAIRARYDRLMFQKDDPVYALCDEVDRLRGLLDDSDDTHIIDLRDDGWTIKHPLACRPYLFDCAVNLAAEEELTGQEPKGRFEVYLAEDGELTLGSRVSDE